MEEWKEYTIGEIADVQTGPFGSQLHEKDYVLSGTPIVTVEHLGNRKFTTQNLPLVSDSDKNRLSKYILQTGDLVFSRVGSVDRCTYTDNESNGWLFSGRCLRVRSNISVDSLWLYYFFCLDTTKSFIRNIAVGATMPSINTKLMCEVPVKLPPLPTQQKIAAILSSLDDKIELNNKINTNLEQQAQALFKTWFVDFEPFGGKMPEGWKVGKLSEIADYLNGLAMQKFRPLEGEEGLPVLKIKELRQGCYDESSELCSPSRIKPEYIIHDGDVIFSWSGSLLVDIWCGGTCGLNQHLFKVTSKTYEKWFYYLWTKHHLDRFIFLATDKATTMGHIKREELDKAEVVIPDDKTYSKLTMTLSPIIGKIINTRIENRKLAYLRDSLLPELMSGNISVEDVRL